MKYKFVLNRTLAIIICTLLTIYYLYVVFTNPLDFWPKIFNFIG